MKVEELGQKVQKELRFRCECGLEIQFALTIDLTTGEVTVHPGEHINCPVNNPDNVETPEMEYTTPQIYPGKKQGDLIAEKEEREDE